MVAALKPFLGVGLYTPAQAAFYARMRTQSMNTWLHGNKQSERVFAPQFEKDTNDPTVTFIDFVQSLAVREARRQYSLSLPKIRAAIAEIEGDPERGVTAPLARQHKLFVFTEGRQKNLVIGLGADEEEQEEYVLATGRQKGQRLLGVIVESFLRRIDFSTEERIATRFTPMVFRDDSIVMDPLRGFGVPMVEGTGYAAEDLAEAAMVEGGINQAAEVYGVTPQQVALACDYVSSLGESV